MSLSERSSCGSLEVSSAGFAGAISGCSPRRWGPSPATSCGSHHSLGGGSEGGRSLPPSCSPAAEVRGRAPERGGPRSLLRKAGEQVGDLLARRLVSPEVQARIAVERPLHAGEVVVHGPERARLAEPGRADQDLHALRVGVELALLVVVLELAGRGPVQGGVVAEDVVGELVGDDGVAEGRGERDDADGEEAPAVAAGRVLRVVAHQQVDERQAVEARGAVGEGADLGGALLLGGREGGAAGEEEHAEDEDDPRNHELPPGPSGTVTARAGAS